jgi:AcrR family transcriptional regulator
VTIETARPSVLADEQRAVGRGRILIATRRMLAERGFAVTVDEIANAAEVGRRTVFRYFASRDELLTAAIADWLHEYSERLPPSPMSGQDPRDWLDSVALQMQVLNVEVGDLFWEIHGRRLFNDTATTDLYTTIAAKLRTKYAADAWLAFGGVGEPPDWVADSFAVQLSAYATNKLLEFGRTPAQIGAVVAATLEAVVRQALLEPDR